MINRPEIGASVEEIEQYVRDWVCLAAREGFDKALEIYPNNSNALYFKGLALSNLGKKEEAKEAYKKALEVNPDDVMAKQAYEELSNMS